MASDQHTRGHPETAPFSRILLRLIAWLFVRVFFRITVKGLENLPLQGGGLLVANHRSFWDGLLICFVSPRPVRVLLAREIYEHPLVRPFARLTQAIPMRSRTRPRAMLSSLREAAAAVAAGELVCVFAEAQVSRIGHILRFSRALGTITANMAGPIIPVHLEEAVPDSFRIQEGRLRAPLPRRPRCPLGVTFGTPLPPGTPAYEVRQAVQQLDAQAFALRCARLATLDRSFIRTARRYPFRFAMGDARLPRLNWGLALTRTIFLSRRLRPVWQEQDYVGILLPPSVAGALINFAATLMGKVPVNLNYTAADDTVASCAQQCNLKTVITSKAFLERVPVKVPAQPVFVEDLIQHPRPSEKLLALLMTWTFPAGALRRALGCTKPARLHDVATIIFSSGSTGDPKGVVLSHYNIAANIEQVKWHLDFHDARGHKILGVLPFFHSFGWTVTVWLPGITGMGAVYHPNPLDAATVATLVRDYHITWVVAAPSMVQAYMRRCSPADFRSVQYMITGAEKLPVRLSRAFQETFGIRLLEGYGCTECAPVVSVNTPDFRGPGFSQIGNKRGRIGHPLPGISVRIADPDTMQPLALGESGVLLVRGPNIMQGYFRRPELTAEALVDGWYNTGDIASLDDEGFLTIADRLSRFSKIGGEMIPHLKIEDKLHELAGATEQSFAVTSIADDRKGERIVVLHTLPEERLKPCLEKLPESSLPPMWKPRPNQFFRVEALPYLGTGKLDLRRLREVAQQVASEARARSAATNS
jgi:acyl-[acyl-carrier-protein]-phospholipid O-acyltransferase/long-chain-fatty-acid--[acyl-carrier-protein] ligase